MVGKADACIQCRRNRRRDGRTPAYYAGQHQESKGGLYEADVRIASDVINNEREEYLQATLLLSACKDTTFF